MSKKPVKRIKRTPIHQTKLNTAATYCQLMEDLFIIAMNEELGVGYERGKRVTKNVAASYVRFMDEWSGTDKAYAKYVIDRKLKEICGNEFKSWEERYSDGSNSRT